MAGWFDQMRYVSEPERELYLGDREEIDSHLFRTDVNGLCKMHCYLTLSKHNLLIDTAGLTLEEICSLLPLSVTLCLNESINQN